MHTHFQIVGLQPDSCSNTTCFISEWHQWGFQAGLRVSGCRRYWSCCVLVASLREASYRATHRYLAVPAVFKTDCLQTMFDFGAHSLTASLVQFANSFAAPICSHVSKRLKFKIIIILHLIRLDSFSGFTCSCLQHLWI